MTRLQQLFRIVALLFLLALPLPQRADVGEVLGRFADVREPAGMLKAANEFFAQLHEEQFLDTLYSYDSSTPADTLRELVWYWAAEYYYDQQHYDMAEAYAQKAIPLFRMGSDRVGESDCLNVLAISNIRLGNYARAASFAQQCLQLDEARGDNERISMSLNTLAAIYMSANQPAEAEKFVLKGLAVATEAKDDPSLAILLGMASEVYHALGNDKQALTYAEEAYGLERKLGREFKATIRLSQKAVALIGLQRFSEAEELLTGVIAFFREAGDQQSLGLSCNKMGMALLGQDRQEEAAAYYREGADILSRIRDRRNEMHSRRGLYECLWKTEPDSAKKEMERFNALRDSLYDLASAEQLARYNAEFGNDMLRKENEEARMAKHNVMVVAVMAIISLLILSLFVWIIMRRRQNRQTAINQRLNANIEELREKYQELSVRYDNALTTSPVSSPTEELTPADKDFLEKTIDTINTLMMEGRLDADSVASQMNMSLYQFRQRITAVTGETPQSFISIIRMRRARYLLENRPEMNISEVALLCAYNDTPNFTRAFKKAFGITPTQYQQKNRNTQAT